MSGRTVRLTRGSSDAALAPYHVDRSKLFVAERLDGTEEGNADRIARAIEYTRFPYASSSNDDLVEEEGLLLRAADLIGQLGDPNYLKKANALFYEFEEIGLNKQLGYDTPADVVYKYPQFYAALDGRLRHRDRRLPHGLQHPRAGRRPWLRDRRDGRIRFCGNHPQP